MNSAMRPLVLYVPNGKAHKYPAYDENAIRLGFASSSKKDLEKSVQIVKGLI